MDNNRPPSPPIISTKRSRNEDNEDDDSSVDLEVKKKRKLRSRQLEEKLLKLRDTLTLSKKSEEEVESLLRAARVAAMKDWSD